MRNGWTNVLNLLGELYIFFVDLAQTFTDGEIQSVTYRIEKQELLQFYDNVRFLDG